MNKNLIVWLIVIASIGGVGMWMMSAYNKMVAQEEQVESAWSQVENEYQRRADFIPQLVAMVKGARDFEKSTMTEVIEARAKATAITIDPSNVTPEQLAAFQAAQGELSQALGRLMAVSENYPELKATEGFRDAQHQLEGCQNRCTVARGVFNEQARAFNTLIRRFPGNVVANFFGFERKPYFEAEESAMSNPTIEL